MTFEVAENTLKDQMVAVRETTTGHSKALNRELLHIKLDMKARNKEEVIWTLIKHWRKSKKESE